MLLMNCEESGCRLLSMDWASLDRRSMSLVTLHTLYRHLLPGEHAIVQIFTINLDHFRERSVSIALVLGKPRKPIQEYSQSELFVGQCLNRTYKIAGFAVYIVWITVVAN